MRRVVHRGRASTSPYHRGVGTIVASKMASGLGDVGDDPGYELEGVELLLGPSLGLARIMRVLARGSLEGVTHIVRGLVPGQTLEAHRGAEEVSAERKAAPPIESGAVLPVDPDGVVNGEAGVAPGEEKPDALLGYEPLAGEETEHLVAEGKLCRMGIEKGDLDEPAIRRPAAAGYDGMNVGVGIEPGPACLDHGDHPGPEALLARSHGRHHLEDRVVGEPAEVSEQLAPAHEVGPKHLGQGEEPLVVVDRFENLVGEEGGELGRSPGSA